MSTTPPTTSQEALDLAWELAYPVKEGQTIPEGTRLLDRSGRNGLIAYATLADITVRARESLTIRTLDPLPEPKPDWLDAPAVLAHVDDHKLQQPAVFTPTDAHPDRWTRAETAWTFHWNELRDVTPLYPKEEA